MAATGPESSIHRFLYASLGLVVFFGAAGFTRAASARDQLTAVATALTEGNAAEAMGSFDRSYPDFEKLRNYFGGLAGAFQLVNEIDVTDEQDENNQADLVVDWTLTLTSPATSATERRNAEIHVRLVKNGRAWKIVRFSPIDMFNPQRSRSTPPG